MQKESKNQSVILVDKHDQVLGCMPKLQAHQQGVLHRAFSVFIFREEQGEKQLLLQKRDPQKYHCGGLWTNTCCSHPRVDEATQLAAERRLIEEMGLNAELSAKGHFVYRAELENGLIEHEYDHVFVGEYQDNASLQINPEEVCEYRWQSIDSLQQQLREQPQLFTPWFEQALQIALE